MSPKTKTKASKPTTETSKEDNLPVKKVKTYELKLSSEELAHLRDLMSVLLPPDGTVTLSQSLASSNSRPMLEAKLWSKLIDLCKGAGIPVGDAAPDYAVGVIGVPTLGVYQIQLHEEEEGVDE